MEKDLLGFVVGALDADEHRQVQQHLAADAEAHEELAALQRAVEPLALDRIPIEPPGGLAERTLAFVEEHSLEQLPHSPTDGAARSLAFPTVYFGRLDVLAAACLLIIAAGLVVPLVYQGLHNKGMLECQDTFRQLYAGLDAYDQTWHAAPRPGERGGIRYPTVNQVADPPKNVAGLVVPRLVKDGFLPKDFRIRCPGGQGSGLPIDFDEAMQMTMEEFRRRAAEFTPNYGYTLGYRSGPVLHGPHYSPAQPASSFVAVMADAGPFHGAAENSPNHGGHGQNVFFSDGSVKFLNTRFAGYDGDDIYSNKLKKVAAGADAYDTVIGPSPAQP
jgi:hypothetical protein